MIKALRKRHLQVWSVWAMALPVGICLSILVRRPISVTGDLTDKIVVWPVLLGETNIDGNKVQLRTNGKKRQLVWRNDQGLATASALIYLASSDTATIKSSIYIGRIESRGDYAFELPGSSIYHFIVYDFIHQMIVRRVVFNGIINGRK